MQCLLNYRQALVRSGTRTCPRKSPVNFCHHRAITGAKLWAAERIVSCSSAVLEVVGDTQSSGGGRSNGPGQDKQTGGGGDPEGRSEAPGWLQGAIQAVGWAKPILGALFAVGVFLGGTAAFGASVCALLGWHASLATKADVTEAKNEVQQSVKDSEDRVQKRVDEKVGELKERVDEKVGELKERVDEKVGEVKKSVDRLTAIVNGLAVIIGVAGVGTVSFFAGRKS